MSHDGKSLFGDELQYLVGPHRKFSRSEWRKEEKRLGKRKKHGNLFEASAERHTDELHDRRAAELEEMGRHKHADRIRSCGLQFGFRTSRCQLRFCPSCSEHKSRTYRHRMASDIRKMEKPKMVLFSLPVYPHENLKEAVSRFRKCLRRLRQRKVFRSVERGSGGVEVSHCELDSKAKWNVHAHVVIDVDNPNYDAYKNAWSQITGHGQFGENPNGDAVRKGAENDAATYACKSDTWCPEPGSQDTEELETLISALHGRQISVRWGFRRKDIDHGQ